MSWRLSNRKDLSHLIDFLLKREWKCAAFSSRLKATVAYGRTRKENFSILINEDKTRTGRPIREAVMLTKFGLVIPVLERDSNFTLHHNNRYRTFLNRYERRLHSIMGPLDSVQKTETLFSKAIRSRIDYYLMTRNLTGLEAYGENDHPGITIRPAVFDDADKLYDLQKEYELEEVFLDPATFNEKECRARLRRDLKRQVVYLAESGGIPVAKAGTNARGYRVDQIGGVFTRACDRKRGIATLLMQSLLVDLGEIKEVFSLFVKKNNQAAINLYKKLGFDKRLDYRITYYAYP